MSDAPTLAIIVVAAGDGTRLAAGRPKALVPLAGLAILEHALRAVFGMSEPSLVVVVGPPSAVEETRLVAERAAGVAVGSLRVVPGGATRTRSVRAGLSALPSSIDTVLVHDAARALAPSAFLSAVAAAVRATGAAVIPGLAVPDTIKRVDGDVVVTTVDREDLRAVQTPQGFPRDLLERAYAGADAEHTDDAATVAAIGGAVRVVPGDERAFKITTPWDLRRAELLLSSSGTLRTGIGLDVHAFAEQGTLRLAGLDWPGDVALAGHSDGDAVAHAVVDALLSAAGLGDIGSVFGTDDPRYAGAAGDVFLSGAVEALAVAGFSPVNVAVQLVGNRPRFAPRRREAENRLSEIVGAPVSIAATTTDGLGFTGRGEGVTAIATALIRARSGPVLE